MKPKKFKKLSLNKKTVANLDEKNMKDILAVVQYLSAQTRFVANRTSSSIHWNYLRSSMLPPAAMGLFHKNLLDKFLCFLTATLTYPVNDLFL